MDEDRILMKKFLEGDEESFEKIIIKYKDSATSFAERYIHDRYMAEDIAQESFAHLYVYRDKYDSKYSFKTYLFTIIHNKSIDYFRKNKDIPLENGDFLSNNIYNPEETFIKKEEKVLLNRNINKLNTDYRTAIYLIDYERFSYKETAKIMEKNLAQMKILVYRARRKLRILMEEGVCE